MASPPLIGPKLSTPKVSVVIAAYNSSARLKCAVTTALRQNYENLEVIVVGDACTDNTEETLKAFKDSRIRWENLPLNWGEQSVPTNRGIELVEGEFTFFLNQDDLWLDSHVSETLELFARLPLDVVWSPFVVLPPESRPGVTQAKKPNLMGIAPAHPQFDPHTFIPASCTAWRTEALRGIGGWRTAAEVVVSPSQDLLWRANRGGLSIRGKASPTVLVLWSGRRPGSYLPSYKALDNEAWLHALLSQPELVSNEIKRVSQPLGPNRKGWKATLVGLIKSPVLLSRKLIEILGWHPLSLEVWWKHRASGGFINTIRAMNNLEPRSFRKSSIRKRRS